MSLLHGTSKGAAEESGAVLVMFAVFTAVAILILAFVLDVGNWFAHQRHLQTQADAAAFAAAQNFQFPCTKQVAETMYKAAGQYGGATSVVAANEGTFSSASPLYNEQIGESTQENIHEEINKKTYFGQPLENRPAETTTVEKAPCDPEAAMVDVKMTETNLPWFFKALNVPYINAHARVSVKAQTTASAVEPLIESEPIEVRIFFVNDNPDGSDSNYNDEMLATSLLTNVGSNEENGTIKWTNASSPVPVSIVRHVGVRVALAGKAGALKGAGNETPAVCGHEYVECFDQDGGIVPPLLNISGYSTEGEGTAVPLAPVAHKVTLSTPAPDTCTDAYFSNSPLSEPKSTCTFTIAAEVQYGKESTTSTGMTVTPELVYTEGFTNKTEHVKAGPMKLENGAWTGTASLPSYFYGNFGSTEINLVVKCKPEAKSPCEKSKSEETKTLTDVQRAFTSGSDGSNRIVGAKAFEPGATNPVPGEKDANAFEICEKADEQKCTHNLAVTIELKGSLEDAKCFFKGCARTEGTPIPPFHITYGDNDQENEDQFVVSCPPTTNKAGVVELYEKALFAGCAGKYGVNTHGGSCAAEKTAQEKLAAEEKAQKERREAEEAAKAKREKEEKEGIGGKAGKEKRAKEEVEAKASREKREQEEHATKEAKEKQEATPHECVGLVEATGAENFKGKNEGELAKELTAVFQNFLAKRVEGAVNGTHFYCPNKWVNSNEGGVPIIPANDSRLVQFFVVPFTVTDFQRKGEVSPLIPIANFATFYITGWDEGNIEVGQGTKVGWNPKQRRDGCSEKLFKKLPAAERAELENEAIPLRQREEKEKEKGFDDNTEQPREIVGHLIKYVNVLGEGSGTVTCKLESFETCEETLTE